MLPKTLVIKLGTSTITHGSKHLNRPHMLEIAKQIAQLYRQGHRIMLPVVAKITADIRQMAGGSGTQLGTGGMSTKITAADIATVQGLKP